MLVVTIYSSRRALRCGNFSRLWAGPGARYVSVTRPLQNAEEENHRLVLPTELALRGARDEASARSQAREIAGAARVAAAAELPPLLERLATLPSGGGALDGRPRVGGFAWDTIAQRAVELSRLGQFQDASVWAQLLHAFASARRVNSSLMVEAQHALASDGERCDATDGGSAGEGSLLIDADVSTVAAIVIASDRLAPPCSTALLRVASSRFEDFSMSNGADCLVGKLGPEGIAGLAGAYARAGVQDTVLIEAVRSLLRSLPSSGVETTALPDGTVPDVASFCHVFGLDGEEEITQLLPQAARGLAHCSLSDLVKLLPLLATSRHIHEAAAAAWHEALEGRLPMLLGKRAKSRAPGGEEAQAIPQLLQALALAGERNVALVMSIAAKCLQLAPSLSAAATLAAATSLAQLRVRQERLLDELAENIVVRHQRALSWSDVDDVLHAWTVLRAPHQGLADALQRRFAAAQPPPPVSLVRRLEAFVKVEAPTLGVASHERQQN